MAKIDLEKLICSLAERNSIFRDALKEQGLEYKDGEIVESQRPNFNVGDWVVDNHGKVNQVTSVTDDSYAFTLYDGTYVSGCWKDYYHLWAIQDAKDGDVLACGDEVTDCPFIFHNLTEKLNPRSYCGVNTLCDFQENDENGGSWCKLNEVRPATNAQRELLFQKMKEAGYKWDAEKKELKKIKEVKASFAHRQLYNRAILKILSDYIEKYPDTRFGQMLYNLGISSGAENNFYVESSKTYQGINARLKEQENGKNRVI